MTCSTENKINVLMISCMYPRPGASTSGIFIKNQLGAYAKFVNIFLYVPVHVTPSIFKLRQQKGIRGKLRELKGHIKINILQKLPAFSTPVTGKYIRYASIPPKEVLPFSGGTILFLRLLFSINMKNKYDVIHGQKPLPDGLAAVFLAKVLKRPSIVTVRGSDVHSVKKDSITYKMVRFVLKHASRITCVSSDLKYRMVDMGMNPKKITVIPNGIDPEFPKHTRALDVCEKYNIPENGKVLGFVGHLTEVKDPLTLLKAFAKVSKKKENVYLMFVGGGELEDSLRRSAEKLSIAQNVRFSGGMVPHAEISSYMNCFDVFCLSSLREGWPNVLFEAMSLGKPVVATKVGGIPEAINSEDFGLLVPPGKPELFAEAVLKALEKKWDHRKIKKYAMDNTWDKVGKRYYEVYRDLLLEANR